MSVPEAEWRPEDVALLIASGMDERGRDENGILWSEATDPANEHAFEAAEKPRVNWATKAKLDAQDAYYAKYDKPNRKVNRNGHIWRVFKKQ